MSGLSQLSDRDLVSRLKELVNIERKHLIEVLRHLNEIERRRLHVELGFSSLFEYCVTRLRYSHSAAGRRIAAARALRRFPEVGGMLARGELNLTTLSMIARTLTRDDKDTFLDRVRGKSQREVERIIAEYRPEAAIRDRVRAVCVKERTTPATPLTPAAPTPGAGRNARALPMEEEQQTNREKRGALNAQPPATRVVQKHEIKFIAGKEFMGKLEQVKALLSSTSPDATLEQVFDAAMEMFLDAKCPLRRARRRGERRKKRQGDADASLPAPGVDRAIESERMPAPGVDRAIESERMPASSRSRHIPLAIRDAVYTRDRGRCAYVAPGGTRCNSLSHIQIDHIVPFARGGTNAASNLRLLCRAHNLHEAERQYGRATIARYTLRE